MNQNHKKRKTKILTIVGARPNFMKLAPLWKVMVQSEIIEPILVHTGQHYDVKMSSRFFEIFNLPEPHHFLGIGSASHAIQTAKIMMAFEEVLEQEKPQAILVLGDVNSTLACSIVATKLTIPCIHVEAGLRSGDFHMPEEINRVLTDQCSQILFTTSPEAEENLKKEGVRGKVYFVGNLMIDNLVQYLKIAREKKSDFTFLENHKKSFSLLTMHRPGNVDDKEQIEILLDFLFEEAKEYPILFPMHPRTKKNIEKFNLMNKFTDFSFKQPELQKGKIYKLPALDYIDLVALLDQAKFCFTDSGGIQEESTFLGIPCLTLRDNTERPITIDQGSNTLGGTKTKSLKEASQKMKQKFSKLEDFPCPPLWDGQASERITNILENLIKEQKLTFF